MGKIIQNSELDLLYELKKGSSQAFESLYKNHFRMVASLISRMGGNQNDVEDIFQETLFVLVKNIRSPEFELTSKISTYMHAIARNLWLKKGHQRRKEISMADEDILHLSLPTENEQEDWGEKELMVGVVLDNLNELEPDCRQVIRLTFLKKMSHSEVANILGYTKAFVKVKKFRCLKYLREKVTASPFFKRA